MNGGQEKNGQVTGVCEVILLHFSANNFAHIFFFFFLTMENRIQK